MAKIKTGTRNKTRQSKNSGKGSSSAGRILGLLLLVVLLGGGAFLYMNPQALEDIKIAAGLAEPAAENTSATPSPPAASGAATPPPSSVEADPQAVEALNMAKVWVDARLAKGINLTDINETLKLSEAEKQHWQSIVISQGTITAVHIKGKSEQPMILLPMQNGGQIAWVCAGDVPAALEHICTQ